MERRGANAHDSRSPTRHKVHMQMRTTGLSPVISSNLSPPHRTVNPVDVEAALLTHRRSQPPSPSHSPPPDKELRPPPLCQTRSHSEDITDLAKSARREAQVRPHSVERSATDNPFARLIICVPDSPHPKSKEMTSPEPITELSDVDTDEAQLPAPRTKRKIGTVDAPIGEDLGVASALATGKEPEEEEMVVEERKEKTEDGETSTEAAAGEPFGSGDACATVEIPHTFASPCTSVSGTEGVIAAAAETAAAVTTETPTHPETAATLPVVIAEPKEGTPSTCDASSTVNPLNIVTEKKPSSDNQTTTTTITEKNLGRVKNVITAKTVHRTETRVSVLRRRLIKSKSMDSSTLQQCLIAGDYEEVSVEKPVVTTETTTSSSTTVTCSTPGDKSAANANSVIPNTANAEAPSAERVIRIQQEPLEQPLLEEDEEREASDSQMESDTNPKKAEDSDSGPPEEVEEANTDTIEVNVSTDAAEEEPDHPPSPVDRTRTESEPAGRSHSEISDGELATDKESISARKGSDGNCVTTPHAYMRAESDGILLQTSESIEENRPPDHQPDVSQETNENKCIVMESQDVKERGSSPHEDSGGLVPSPMIGSMGSCTSLEATSDTGASADPAPRGPEQHPKSSSRETSPTKTSENPEGEFFTVKVYHKPVSMKGQGPSIANEFNKIAKMSKVTRTTRITRRTEYRSTVDGQGRYMTQPIVSETIISKETTGDKDHDFRTLKSSAGVGGSSVELSTPLSAVFDSQKSLSTSEAPLGSLMPSTSHDPNESDNSMQDIPTPSPGADHVFEPPDGDKILRKNSRTSSKSKSDPSQGGNEEGLAEVLKNASSQSVPAMELSGGMSSSDIVMSTSSRGPSESTESSSGTSAFTVGQPPDSPGANQSELAPGSQSPLPISAHSHRTRLEPSISTFKQRIAKAKTSFRVQDGSNHDRAVSGRSASPSGPTGPVTPGTLSRYQHLRVSSDDSTRSNESVENEPMGPTKKRSSGNLRRKNSEEQRENSPQTPPHRQESPALSEHGDSPVPQSSTPPTAGRSVHAVGRSKSAAATIPSSVKKKFQHGRIDEDNAKPLAPTNSVGVIHQYSSSDPFPGKIGESPAVQSEQQFEFETPNLKKDKRYLIVDELYNVEKEYVEALTVLVDKYMIPLKSNNILDKNVVDDIFYKIPEIATHHSIFLSFLEGRWKDWDSRETTVGDRIAYIFTKQSVVESYTSFIENYHISQKNVEHLLSTKSSFQKFVETVQRDGRRKLPLKALLIQPAQRIPRYELLLKRLIEYTPNDHPDSHLLLEAENAIHDLALKINSVKEANMGQGAVETLKVLEMLLMTELVSTNRIYIRHDIISVEVGADRSVNSIHGVRANSTASLVFEGKKEQVCVFMFTDQIIFTSIKRKSDSRATRKPALRLQSPTGLDFIENIKYKVWFRIGVESVEIVHGSSSRDTTKSDVSKSSGKGGQKTDSKKDLSLLIELSDLAGQLSCTHEALDEALKGLMNKVCKGIESEDRKTSTTTEPSAEEETNHISILATTPEGIKHIELLFGSPEKKNAWENAFLETKFQLTAYVTRKPEFTQALQITKTRSGMQFSCAATIDGYNQNNFRDVWICKSDGYVGHLCLLSLQPEPIVTLNTPVPGCNTRITCVCAVPAHAVGGRRAGSLRRRRNRNHPSQEVGDDVEEEEEEDIEESSDSPDSESSSDSSDSDTTSPSRLVVDVDDGSSEGRKESMEDRIGSSRQRRLTDPFRGTMWLGTEDGWVLVFYCNDNIKTTRNRQKIQQRASVLSIIYLDNKVYLSLANGDVVVYKRNAEGLWEVDDPLVVTASEKSIPIQKMVAVAGSVWCGCQRDVIVLNQSTLKSERSFTVGHQGGRRVIHSFANAGHAVWISLENSTKLFLYHAITCEFLLDVDVSQVTLQKLQHCDDIIKQHKSACLRITCLMVCKDLLWVGTSAGVILTITSPKVTSMTTRNSLRQPIVTGLDHGHTGHVRFITSVEMSGAGGRVAPGQHGHHHHHAAMRRASLSPCTTMATQMLVIVGGDGYEDFSPDPHLDINETGKDDSLNHLLIWQV